MKRKKLPLKEVLITDQLHQRTAAAIDQAIVNRSTLKLTQHLSENPSRIFTRLVQTAKTLCGADSAGISLLEKNGEREVFRWKAVAGSFSKYQNGIMPLESPCGVVINKGSPQLFSFPDGISISETKSIPPLMKGCWCLFRSRGKT